MVSVLLISVLMGRTNVVLQEQLEHVPMGLLRSAEEVSNNFQHPLSLGGLRIEKDGMKDFASVCGNVTTAGHLMWKRVEKMSVAATCLNGVLFRCCSTPY